MHIHEFELRYRSYVGLNHRLKLGYDTESFLLRVHRKDCGPLTKKLTEIEPSELKTLTQETYTDQKYQLLKNTQVQYYGEFVVSDYIQRLEYELKVIHEMGYDSYLLVVQDYINRAKQHNIGVGPGRGSAAGSLVSRCVGITDVDPLPYGLLFERFLNPARVSMPDIDVDFEDTLRDQVIEYIKNHYGKQHIASIGTFMKMGAKAAFKDVARVMGVGFDRANQISNLIIHKTLAESISTSDELKNIQDSDEIIATTLRCAQGLEGVIRQIGVHACGIIISPTDVTDYSAVQHPPIAGKNDVDRGKLVTQYDGHVVEDIGLLKMDFLGLRNLSIIKNTIKILDAKAQIDHQALPGFVSEYLQTMSFAPPLDDMLTYQKVFQTGDTSGVFQFESDGMRNYLSKLKPNDINDIVAMGALYRPGPMEFIPRYIARKNGQEDVRYMTEHLAQILEHAYSKAIVGSEQIKLDEDLTPFLGLTYGIPVYQEQLMFLVQAMAGFSLAEADLLRRGIGKKIKEIIEKIKIDFVQKCQEYRGYKPETSTYIYETMIEPAALYSFNKSHAVAYGLISYQTAYLKANYPLEFHAALLRSVEDDTEKMAKFINEIKLKGIIIKNPDINTSYNHVAAIDDHIRLGLLCIKGVGYEVGECIQVQRQQNGLYKDLEDFLTRCQTVINKKSLESLVKSGGLDCFGDRAVLLENISEMLEWCKKSPNMGVGLFAGLGPSLILKNTAPMSHRNKLLAENEVFKTFISGHPFDGLYDYIKSKHHLITMFKQEDNFGETSFVGYVSGYTRARKKGFFIKIEDISGTIELFTKDMMDLSKFDLLIVEGFKGKSFRLKKITKTSIDVLIGEAKKAGSYKESDSIALVLQKRGLNKQINTTIQDTNQTIDHTQTTLGINSENTEIHHIQDQNNIIDPSHFALPKRIDHITQISQIIKTHPGTEQITIGSKTYQISPEAYEQIKNIISGV